MQDRDEQEKERASARREVQLRAEVQSRRLYQIERRLNELGSMCKGNQSFQADRLSDVLEQIEEVRGTVAKLTERVDRMAEYLNQKRKGESETHP